MPPKILVIVGPTASGKTRLAVELAHEWNGEVVSADSMQVYRRMDIGTAKPTAEEMDGIPHHMIDVADPGEDFSAARYVEMASACVDGILARGRLPIVAGGTGLYIDSLLSGRTFAAFSPDSPLRGELEAELARRGGAAMLEELARVDPETAARLHPNDHKRIVRALEVFRSTGRTISQHDRETRALPPRYDALTIGLTFRERADLWARIGGWTRWPGTAWRRRCGGCCPLGCPGRAPPCRPLAIRNLWPRWMDRFPGRRRRNW